jgi:DNA (cytosine-5)-methyltransferase 1
MIILAYLSINEYIFYARHIAGRTDLLMYSVPVIDLFAGPGGLGEGFSSFIEKNIPGFRIVLSIEKDPDAHSTLELRSFYRQFKPKEVPSDYYSFLRREISREDLFSRYPDAASNARSEAKLATLGKIDENLVDHWICKALKSNNREWVLIGGPPCQAYSLVGRSRNKGKEGYKPIDDDRHYLYKEYLRIISRHWPSVFVMENVKGLLSSRVEGQRVFETIFNDLENPGKASGSAERYHYRIYSLVETGDTIISANSKFTVMSENYGIPQARHRVILLGVRDSAEFTNLKPDTLQPIEQKVSAWDVLADLPRIRSGLTSNNNGKTWVETIKEIRSCGWYHNLNELESNKINDMIAELSETVNDIPELGSVFIQTKTLNPSVLKEWFVDDKIKGVCNHITRNHMPGDLHRYFYSACYADLYGRSPKLSDFPRSLLPAHKNVEKSIASKTLFCDRFRVQLPGKPSTTITSHIAKDGHYYIHPDPVQCRCLSVREAARLQTFPDNYFFCGSRTAQYTQVGNAVPPLLASKIALIVNKLLIKSRRNHA